MANKEALTFLEGQIEKQITITSNSRRFYKLGCLLTTIITACLTSITTLLIGAGQYFTDQKWIALVALATSASITVVSAIDGFYRFHEMWVQKAQIAAQLDELKSRLKFAIAKDGDTLEAKITEDFNERYLGIMKGENEAWMGVRASSSSGKGALPHTEKT